VTPLGRWLRRRRHAAGLQAAEQRLAAGPAMLAAEANPRARAGTLHVMSSDLEALAVSYLVAGAGTTHAKMARHHALTNSQHLLLWLAETEFILASVIEEGPDNQWSLLETLGENSIVTPWAEAWPILEALCVEADRGRRTYLLGRLHNVSNIGRGRPLTAVVTGVIDAYRTGTW